MTSEASGTSDYFVKRGGKISGPFSLDQIETLDIQEQLKPTDLISSSGAGGPWEEFWIFGGQIQRPDTEEHANNSNTSLLVLCSILVVTGGLTLLFGLNIFGVEETAIPEKVLAESKIHEEFSPTVENATGTDDLKTDVIKSQSLDNYQSTDAPQQDVSIWSKVGDLSYSAVVLAVGIIEWAVVAIGLIALVFGSYFIFSSNRSDRKAAMSSFIVFLGMLTFWGMINDRPNRGSTSGGYGTDEISKIIEAKEIVKSQLNYPDTAEFHSLKTKVNGNKVELTVTAKNAFGVPETHNFEVDVQ